MMVEENRKSSTCTLLAIEDLWVPGEGFRERVGPGRNSTEVIQMNTNPSPNVLAHLLFLKPDLAAKER
jgi:hypothetical protein